jgi:hypothetical protein
MNALPILLLGGAALMMMGGGGTKKKTPDAWMKALARKTGDPDWDPANRDREVIITDLQETLDVEPVDGQWSPQLELAVKQMYREL